MKKRIAKKILDPYGRHWSWYCRNNLWSLAPKRAGMYFKACKVMHYSPYYDSEWLSNIQKWRKEDEK